MTAKKTAATPAAIDEVRAEMLPDASAAADDAEVVDAMESAGITVAKRAAQRAPAKKAPAKADEPTVSLWVGRKIAEVAKAQKRGSLGAKFRAVTPPARWATTRSGSPRGRARRSLRSRPRGEPGRHYGPVGSHPPGPPRRRLARLSLNAQPAPAGMTGRGLVRLWVTRGY